MEDGEMPPRGGWAGWAVFLGMSWTWCIGMFLPVLLVRDLGWLGWAVFAIPNVMGAAAMGWVVRSGEASARLVERHRPACVAFSLVTVAFHLFFAEWFIGHRLLSPVYGVGVWFAAYLFYFLGGSGGKWDRVSSGVALVISLACAGVAIYSLRTDLIFNYPTREPLPAINAASLAPVCVFGFLLCPYLDLTFHRARQVTSQRGAKLAFSVGFGVFFLAMIVFTYLYVWPVARMLEGARYPMARALRYALGVHLIVQSGLTIALHLRAVPRPRKVGGLGLAMVVLIVPLVVGNVVSHMSFWKGVDPGEIAYRVFLGFYGLVFPAYAWIVMLPRKREISMARGYVATAAAVALGAPFFYLGFVEERMVWLLPGLALVLLVRLAPLSDVHVR
jgi:hypothetical protein